MCGNRAEAQVSLMTSLQALEISLQHEIVVKALHPNLFSVSAELCNALLNSSGFLSLTEETSDVICTENAPEID